MIDATVLKRSVSYAAAAVAYVALVATLMNHAQRVEQSPLGPVVFLLLLVVSAATMGMLIFGKPVMLYMDGRKKEAVATVTCTIGSLALLTILLFLGLTVL